MAFVVQLSLLFSELLPRWLLLVLSAFCQDRWTSEGGHFVPGGLQSLLHWEVVSEEGRTICSGRPVLTWCTVHIACPRMTGLLPGAGAACSLSIHDQGSEMQSVLAASLRGHGSNHRRVSSSIDFFSLPSRRVVGQDRERVRGVKKGLWGVVHEVLKLFERL